MERRTSPPGQLYLLFTPELCRDNPWKTLEAALHGGVELVQWRVAEADQAGLRRCLDLCHRFAVPVIVNDLVDQAIQQDAMGAHVGQSDMPATQARELLGPDRWLGVSTHDTEQIRTAAADGADHLGFGPIFPTATKGYGIGQGPKALRRALDIATLPIFAIGGITLSNLGEVLDTGCTRVAVSSAILQAEDPGTAASHFARSLRRKMNEPT